MSKNPNKWDGIIAAVLKDKNNDISGLFDCVFSYLERKTQFFDDFERSDGLIRAKLDEYLARHHAGKRELEERLQKRREALAEKQRAKEEKQGLKEELREILEKIEAKKREREEKEKDKKKEDWEKDKGEEPYKCGGVTEKYIWNQNLVELWVVIPLPKETKADDLNVEMSENRLHVSIKGKESEPILDGEWHDKINPADCLWTVETYEGTGKTLNLNIQKFPEFQGWWECVVKGEPKIDVGKVNPEENNLQYLDAEVQKEVAKAMFDQRQRSMGLPTIEEMENQKKMEEIFKKNPSLRSQFASGPPPQGGRMGGMPPHMGPR